FVQTRTFEGGPADPEAHAPREQSQQILEPAHERLDVGPFSGAPGIDNSYRRSCRGTSRGSQDRYFDCPPCLHTGPLRFFRSHPQRLTAARESSDRISQRPQGGRRTPRPSAAAELSICADAEL